MPGVQSRDGKLYWNDKPIRLMMNGKNLFGGDQIIGQLPAEVAKKLKLYDRKSELSRHTGNDDGDEDHVLDIQVKPGFLDKWYGELSAQYQTKDRYMFTGQASKLSDHDPQMVYAQANNANRYIDRTMRQSMNSNIDGDGKSQYGSYNYQHNWQTKGTDKYDNNRFDISANFGHRDGSNTFNQTTETFFPNQEHTFSMSRQQRNSHKIMPKLQASLFAYTDSVNTININAKATYEKSRDTYATDAAKYGYESNQFQYHTLDAVFAAKPGDALYDRIITRNSNWQTTNRQTRNLTIDYSWKRFFGKKGSFSLSGSTSASGSDNNTHISQNIEYLRDGQNENMWQYYDRYYHDLNTNLSASLSYWLGKKVYVDIADNVAYGRTLTNRNNFVDTDERLVVNGTPTTADHSNDFRNLMHTWTNRLTLRSTITPAKALMIMPRFAWTVSREKSDYRYGSLDTATVRTSMTYVPSLFLKWKMSRVRNMDISFAYNTTVPDLVSTFGFRNTVDPLSISTGNPLLHNTHSHTTAFNYHRMWLRKQIVLGLGASYTKDINPLATLYRYNSSTGVYESKPMNVRGGDRWKFNFNYDQGLGVYVRVMNKFELTNEQSYGFLTIVDNDDRNAVPELNHQKRFGINDDFKLSYELDKFRLEVFNYIEYSRYRYDDASYNSNPLSDRFGVSSNIYVGPLSFYVSMWDRFRSGYKTAEMNGHKLIATAEIEYKFCKNKCRLTLYFDDIFNNDINYDSRYSAYQRSETNYNYLHHYASLKFTYRFDAKAKKK